MPDMELGSNGLVQLKLAEGFMPKLYNDGGKEAGYCTIGYGHLVHYDPCDGKKYTSEHQFINGITIRKATVLLKKDYAWAEKAVNDLVKVPLSQNQFDALVLFTFNVGRGSLASSTLLKYINAKKFAQAPTEFRKWNKSNGKVISGLTNRREMEIKLFRKK